MPIENSLHGSIHENYDRLKSRPLHIVGETQLRIRQCLIARPGSSVGMIRRVASHPVALAQCRRFFAERPQVEAVTAYDTAGAVQDLMKGGLATQGAIASRLAAELYGAQVLLEGIEDDPENYTRFLLLAREAGTIEAATKTSIVFVLDNKPGALYRRARRLRLAQRRPVQARVASAARPPLGVLVLPRRARRPARRRPGRRSRSWAAAAASCGSSAPTRRASAGTGCDVRGPLEEPSGGHGPRSADVELLLDQPAVALRQRYQDDTSFIETQRRSSLR